MTMWSGLLLPATGLLWLHKVDEFRLIADRVEIGIVEGVDAVAAVGRHGLSQVVDRPAPVPLQSPHGGDGVEDLAGARIAGQGLLDHPQPPDVFTADAVDDARPERALRPARASLLDV